MSSLLLLLLNCQAKVLNPQTQIRGMETIETGSIPIFFKAQVSISAPQPKRTSQKPSLAALEKNFLVFAIAVPWLGLDPIDSKSSHLSPCLPLRISLS